MFKGVMRVLEDMEIKKEIWREGDDQYYKGGVTGDDYCVLYFTAQVGRFYSDLNSEDFNI